MVVSCLCDSSDERVSQRANGGVVEQPLLVCSLSAQDDSLCWSARSAKVFFSLSAFSSRFTAAATAVFWLFCCCLRLKLLLGYECSKRCMPLLLLLLQSASQSAAHSNPVSCHW